MSNKGLSYPPTREKINPADIAGMHPLWVLFFQSIYTICKQIENIQVPPIAANAPGVKGTILWDANYIYVCTATDTWKRVALATW